MQRLIKIIALLLFALPSFAKPITIKDNQWRYEIEDDGNVTVYRTGYCVEEVLVPEAVTHNGKTYYITSIGKGAFKNRRNLNKVVVDGRISIQDSAFVNCPLLESVCYRTTAYWYSVKNSQTPYNNISPKAFVDCPKYIPSTDTDVPKTAKLRISDEDGTVRYAENDSRVMTLDSTDLDKKIEVIVDGCEVKNFAILTGDYPGNVLLPFTDGSILSEKDKEMIKKYYNSFSVFLTDIKAYKKGKQQFTFYYIIRVRK